MNEKKITSGFFDGTNPTDKKINFEGLNGKEWEELGDEGSFV